MTDVPVCRLSGEELITVLDLGLQPLGNGFCTDATPTEEYFYPLQCGFTEESALFQLLYQPEPERMFHSAYAFLSGTSAAMAKHFESLALGILDLGQTVNEDRFVVEIGSNDGILLKHFAERGIRHLGIEPSENVAEMAEAQGITVKRSFFSEQIADEIVESHGLADIVTASNVACHIPDIRDLSLGISKLLSPRGLLVFEDPYLGDVIRKNSYDQIYDEHVFLFSCLSVIKIFERVGMELIDVEHLGTHGGSMRYTLAHQGAYPVSPSVDHAIQDELKRGLNRVETFFSFANRVASSSEELKRVIEEAATAGKIVVSYGATSKSTTVFNYAQLGPEHISCVYDNTAGKVGRFTPGMHIPVVHEQLFANTPADVAFLGAWNHASEIRAHNSSFESRGGKWLTHVPNVHFI